MSRKLLAKGLRRIERQLPLNQHIRLNKQVQTQGLEVPTDFKEFAKLCRIRSGSSIVPFELWDWQEELSQVADRCRGLIAAKTRQLGVTETFACKMLHKACRNNAYSGAVLSMGGKETSKVAKRVRRMPGLIPGFKFAGNAVTHLEVSGGGAIAFCPSTDNAVRSIESVHDLLFDESAFVANIAEIYSSAVPAQEMVGDAARTWVISTMSPEGRLAWFWHEMFAASNGNIDVEERLAKAREGVAPFQWWIDENGWAKVIIHWKIHPIYSQVPNYLEKTKKEKKLTEDKLQREYNLGLPESGGSLFLREPIDKCAISQWKQPTPKRTYIAGIDPNFGGNDYYVCLVWDITTKPYNLVAQFRENNRSNTYNEEKTVELLSKYKPVITAVEKNSGGAIVLEKLIKQCPKLRFEPVVTTSTSKRVNTDRLALAVEFHEVAYPKDWEGILEMKNFSLLTRQATSGNDDCISAWAVAWAWLEAALEEQERMTSILRLFK
jgi:hypothetical protein